MNRHSRIVHFIGLIALSFAGLAAAQLPPPQEGSELDRELGIMARVIEESLDRSSLEGWHRIRASASAFEPRVQFQHIPTVGVMFTIPVSFPVIDRARGASGKETAPRKTEEPDLWEKHSSSKPDGGNVDLEVLRPLGELGEVISESVRESIAGVNQSFEVLGDKVFIAPRTAGWAEYDESKVLELRRVLLEATGRYAHRIEHLSASEKVVLIVESRPEAGVRVLWPSLHGADLPQAPQPPAPPMPPSDPEPALPPEPPDRLAEADQSFSRAFDQFENEAADWQEELQDGIEKGKVNDPERARVELEKRIAARRAQIEQRHAEAIKREVERRVAPKQIEIRRFQRKGSPVRLGGFGDASAALDRYFLILNKSDLTASVPGEELVGKASEHRISGTSN